MTLTLRVRNIPHMQIKYVLICVEYFTQLSATLQQHAKLWQNHACCCGTADLLVNCAAFSGHVLLTYINVHICAESCRKLMYRSAQCATFSVNGRLHLPVVCHIGDSW